MVLRFPIELIQELAGNYRLVRNEDVVMGFREEVQHQGFLTRQQLHDIAYWKSPRRINRINNNSEEYVREITHWAFTAQTERARIKALQMLDGIKWPKASAILHHCHQNRYPVLDFRALWSVSIEEPPPYTFEFWWEYVEFCRKEAEKADVEMRTLDRALWQYSKEYQPRRNQH